MLKENVAKTCEFIDVTTANQMLVEALAEEVHTHAQKINKYGNGRLTVAQQEINSMFLDQMNTMNIAMNSMKLAITQTLKPPQHAPLLAIGNTAMDDSDDIPAPVTGSRSRRIEEDGTLTDACLVKIFKITNKDNPAPKKRHHPQSTLNTNQWIVQPHTTLI